jgi:AcrR family transcriptional regulator
MVPRYKKEDRDDAIRETRGRILEAAAEEFSSKGYEGANVNHIAEAAGFSIGTFYNYFPSKRELMLAFIDEIGQKHVDFMTDLVKKQTDPTLRVEAFFEAGFTFVQTNLTEAWAIFITLNGPDEEFKNRLFQAYQPLFHLLSDEILEPGSSQGDFRQMDPESTSGLLMLIYLGTSSRISPEGKHWIGAEQVADFVKHALRPL